ncbi:unnamed protein product [Litomosoides sigmodontis]|uniref:MAGUK p55 subfamily member 5 n=1 Tax=Litomosoides sigmodontis TaxID=42156 RepID=A0A3P6T2K4_LITSI|nr:unnamed protein product [Litomosoides sigmodontis]
MPSSESPTGNSESHALLNANAQSDSANDEMWDGIASESFTATNIITCAENEDEGKRLKNYENYLRRRREFGEYRTNENAFLRESLRGSGKLLSLENHKGRKELLGWKNSILSAGGEVETGYANGAYMSGDTFCDNTDVDRTKLTSLEEVAISMNHVVKGEGREEEESELMHDFFMQKPVRKAIGSNVGVHKMSKITEPKATTSADLLSIITDCDNATIVQSHLKIVKFSKCSDAYLGATIRNEGEKVIVARVIRGGMAEKSNLLKEGDELIEANGNDLRGKNVTEVCNVLKSMSGELSLVIAPFDKSNDNSQRVSSAQVRHFRALFDYDPEDDIYVPCKELALKFQRGDILHVISTSDENWWQAYREGCEMNGSLAGLIPSISFQRQTALCAREFERENKLESGKHKDFFGCTKGKSLIRGRCKKGIEELRSVAEELSGENDEDSEILTYEEVTLYLSKTGRKRPLVLCGPEGVGCLELRQRLAEFDKDKFASAIPHTTRPKKVGEIGGIHYHFVTKRSFQEDAKAGKFIEYGEFEKYLYGTSLASVQAVIDRAKICLLTLKAENLKALRRTTFMPYVIFIAPPSLQQLRRQKEILGQRGIKDEQLKLILSEGKTTEKHYGHLFDRIIVNIDLDRSLEELKEVIRKLETEPHWVPSFWPVNTTSVISSAEFDGK